MYRKNETRLGAPSVGDLIVLAIAIVSFGHTASRGTFCFGIGAYTSQACLFTTTLLKYLFHSKGWDTSSCFAYHVQVRLMLQRSQDHQHRRYFYTAMQCAPGNLTHSTNILAGQALLLLTLRLINNLDPIPVHAPLLERLQNSVPLRALYKNLHYRSLWA